MGTFQENATRTYTRGPLRLLADGRMAVDVLITNDAGKLIGAFEVRIPVAGPILDQDGQQLSASVPVGISNTRTSLISAIDSAIDNAAAAGKFAR